MPNEKRLIRLPFTKRPVKLAVFERPGYREDLELMNSSQVVFDTFKDYSKAGTEFFCVIYLDPKNQVIEVVEASAGTIDTAAVYPREIMKAALILGAAAIIVFHNHPSGDPEPSLCDKEITKEIVGAGKLLQVRALDHVIIGRNKYFSFADHGLMDDYANIWAGRWEN
jgi:DNA repair protein RadC